jgi:hypothetical protein
MIDNIQFTDGDKEARIKELIQEDLLWQVRITKSLVLNVMGSLSEIILGPNSNFVISDGALWTKDMQTKIVELAK